MATSVITGTIKDASGTALSGVTVLAKLRPFGFGTAGAIELATQVQTTTNGSGVYQFTLERTADILPTGTWYEIEEQIPAANGGRQVWAITVGAANASVYASLITTPPDAGTAAQYLTQTAGDARYVALGTLTTQGDIPYASGAGVWTRLAKGTGLQYLRMNAGATAPEWATLPTIPTTAVFYTTHTWAIPTPAVASGETDYIIPMFVEMNSGVETQHIVKVDGVIHSGTNVGLAINKNGVGMTGLTALTVTTSAAGATPTPIALSNGDQIVPIIGSVSGSPRNMTITVVIRHTVTLA